MQYLRNQILALVVGLVLVTATTILVSFWVNTSQYTRDRVVSEINTATESFRQLLDSRETDLINSAELLTADFGFKQAVATQDAATINSVLFNHGNRVGADLMFLTDLGGTLQAATHPGLEAGTPFPYPRLIDRATSTGGALSFVRLDDTVYQLVILPVRAPKPIAFAGIGFEMDLDVARQLKALTRLDVTFMVDGNAAPSVSTIDEAQMSAALASGEDVSPYFGLPLADTNTFVSRHIDLVGPNGVIGEAILSASLVEAYEGFASLRNDILLLSMAILALAVAGSMFLSRNISGPLNRLVLTSLRMARGEYDQAPDEDTGSREVRTLFNAFREMGKEIKERESQITYQAQHDVLTGLLIRSMLIEKADESVVGEGSSAMIMNIGLKGLKDINDTLGPDVGDDLLAAISARLTRAVGKALPLARTGTDEFAIAMPLHDGRDPAQICTELESVLHEPIKVRALSLKLDMNIGYAVSPQQGDNATDLLRRASIALERARHNQDAIRAYVDGEDQEQLRRLQILNDLKHALAVRDGQLYMTYQPKLNLHTGTIDKLEALIRWKHPKDGMVSPEMFIALAEQSNLITELTDWVIKTVIGQCAAWSLDLPDIQIAVNISSQDLEREELLPFVKRELKQFDLPHHVIAFEMTERDMMNDADRAITLMNRFSEDGFTLSVDDYGIGQSSLSKLKQMPIDEIKIDKAFITHLDTSTEDQVIVHSTIELGHRFGLKIIAEGVENEATQQLLLELGCDFIQGYYLSRPLDADQVLPWIKQFLITSRSTAAQ